MAHELKLKKGQSSLTISSGRYGLGADFVPPSTNWALNMSGSTSANRMGGSTVISRRAINTEMAFTVYISGGSTAEVDRGIIDIARMLDMAGDENEPLYLQWRGNSDLPVPVWGQFGAPLSLEIVSGSVMRDDLYGLAGRRADTGRVTVSLVVKPYWLGSRQKGVGSVDGVMHDRYKYYTDGRSRGLMVMEATTNKMTNPIFSHATPDNGWSVATVVKRIVYDPDWILFHAASVRVEATGGQGQLYQSINVGNINAHVLSCYAKLPDGGAISATQCALYYGSAKTTTYTAVGNGWYRLTAAVTGVSGATNTGIQIESGYSVYVDGFQIEEKAYPTPLAYGELPGCAWSGTEHASTTARTAGETLLYPGDSYNLPPDAEMAIAIVWKTGQANTHANDQYLIDSGSFEFYFKASDDKFYLTDGTTTISSAAQTFSAGDILHLVIVAQPGELRIYKNGVSLASGAAWDPQMGALTIGSTATPASHMTGTIMGFTVYDVGLTQAQVTSIYSAALPLMTDGEIVDWMPTFLAMDLSINDTHQYQDSTHRDWVIIDGIPGNMAADTIFENSVQGAGTYQGLTLALNPCDDYMDVSDSFDDCQGTAFGGALGSEVDRSAAFTTAETTIPESAERISLGWPAMNYYGKMAYAAAKIADNGTGLLAYLKIGNANGEWQSLAADTSLRYFLVGPVVIPQMEYKELVNEYRQTSLTASIVCKRTGSSATVDLDYYRILIGKVAHIVNNSGLGSYSAMLIHGMKAFLAEGTAFGITAMVRGEPVEPEPDKINYMFVHSATIGDTAGISLVMNNDMQVAPRWSLA